MTEGSLAKNEIQEKHRNASELSDAAKLLKLLGTVDIDELQTALNAIQTAKNQSPNKQSTGYKNYIDKTLVYDDQDAYIYQRGDTKSGIWYFRIYNKKTGKPVFKSLKTTDKVQATAAARVIYMDIKGKIDRGENLKSITTKELTSLWLEKLKSTISNIPHEGITEGSYKSKRYWMRNWNEYIRIKNLATTPIDRIKPQQTRDFCEWLKSKPKQTSMRTGARAREGINNNANEVIRMYHQLAVREKYISVDSIIQIDRLKYKVNDEFKRDIFRLEQYDRYIHYLKRNYTTKKHNPRLTTSGSKGLDELEKRKIFTEFILILSNAGFRPKEVLGMKFNEIYSSPSFTEEENKELVVMKVRRENSKTGKERRVVCKVKKRIDRIIASYKKLNIVHEPNDYLLINPLSPKRSSYGRMIMYQRLKDTLVASGLQEELDKEDKSITPYSFRHFYAYLRLINKVPIHLLAKNMGTSVQKIESTYGHINTELHAEVLTKGQGIIKRTETNLSTLPTIDDD